jgi:hypothetical protein
MFLNNWFINKKIYIINVKYIIYLLRILKILIIILKSKKLKYLKKQYLKISKYYIDE